MQVRPPSVPLAVRSPYLSTWLHSTELAEALPQFWNGEDRGFAGLARIDGHLYAWAGLPEVNGKRVTAMTQTSVQVTATRSVFTLSARGVELTAEWLSPIEPGGLKRQSVPFSYLNVAVRATDGASHHVQVYAEITGQWASSDKGGEITWQAITTKKSRYWSVQLKTQEPLGEYEQMAQWGHAIWGCPRAAKVTHQSGYSAAVRQKFANGGRLANTSDKDFRAIDDRQPVFAFAQDFGTVRASQQLTRFLIGHVRTPLASYGTDGTHLLPLWTRYWRDWQAMADYVLADAAAARDRAVKLDAKIEQAATAAGGVGYSAMCALAARQCYGGMELAIGPDGSTWLLGKELSTGAGVNTVDIFDQAYLMWLFLDPGLIPLVMAPILTWCASGEWQKASLWTDIPSWKHSKTRYCVHNLGVYPVAKGRVPGNGEQMPIEESAGMLIMAASYARKVGAATARPFLAKWHKLWTQWAEYLLTQVPSPEKQLTTDDWTQRYRRPRHGVNLGIKAIIGLAAASQIAHILGDTTNANKWSKAARSNVGPWVTRSTDASGQYLNLEQGASGTWTCLYNAYYQQVIGEQLVPTSVAAMEASFFEGKLTKYGMPMQTGVSDINKIEWLVYTASWLRSYPIADDLLNRSFAFINHTHARVPYPDRYHTSTAVEAGLVSGLQAEAHPTVGAVFALLAV
jgi:hypothetical protein